MGQVDRVVQRTWPPRGPYRLVMVPDAGGLARGYVWERGLRSRMREERAARVRNFRVIVTSCQIDSEMAMSLRLVDTWAN